MKTIVIIIIILIIIAIILLIISQNEDISTTDNLDPNHPEAKLLYSYGLFSNDPMTQEMEDNIKHNERITGLSYEVLGPKEVEYDLDIIEDIVPGITNAYNSVPRGVAKSDIARLVSLYVRGGHYTDLDVVFKRLPPIKADQVTLYTETFSLKDNNFIRIANFALASPSKHEFVKDVLYEVVKRVNISVGKLTWSDNDVLNTTGPDVVTSIYHQTRNKYHKDTGWNSVRRIGFLNSRKILSHKCAGSWRNHQDKEMDTLRASSSSLGGSEKPLNCPKCNLILKSDNYIIIHDGGSILCRPCDTIYHVCNGIIRYGSPGPLMCKHCKQK